ncbi:hypothetical protein M0812_06349 [Anaeramoeba flamelloides]|uniref:Uncharacterized protein n=1 Tax=Anaeramoeba flamelloides TaxID=1746091 RepID=A0AAV8ABT2_9EUKA|nr:hypothetical protein M0812_06349 [Anaeramoeba flamelloides]
MRCVDAFEDAGIYPLKILKINNDVPIFPAEVKEFSFSNFNYGGRIKIETDCKQFNFGDENNIIHITRSSSIEQFNKRLINDENNRKNEEDIRKNHNQKETNESLLNENQKFLNSHSTEINSSRNKQVTLQPKPMKCSVNSNSERHQLYGTESPIEPTIQTRITNSHEEELITPPSPGRTSITPSKNYINSNITNFLHQIEHKNTSIE